MTVAVFRIIQVGTKWTKDAKRKRRGFKRNSSAQYSTTVWERRAYKRRLFGPPPLVFCLDIAEHSKSISVRPSFFLGKLLTMR